MHPSPPDPGWLAPLTGAQISDADFARLGAFIESVCGIQVAAGKKIMLEGRLRRRLRQLGLDNFSDYTNRVLAGGDEAEVRLMIDEISTNKTDFFRESHHFDYLTTQALPALLRESGGQRLVRIWSAACSSGEEPFTLAMVLSEAALVSPGLSFQILASDISTEMLSRARAATYDAVTVEPVPLALRQKYLLRRRDGTPQVRVVPTLRDRVRFRRLNLMDSDYALGPPLEAIFCRNVFIYFSRRLQSEILDRFVSNLVPGGYLFLGHSESINGFDVALTQVAPTVYCKVDVKRRRK